MKPAALYVDTLRALAAPRRAVPIALISVPLLASQHLYSHHWVSADLVALGMVAVFLLVGPFSYRLLFPPGGGASLRAVRFLAFVGLGGLPPALGFASIHVLALSPSFLTTSVNLTVAATFFWVGSWGLARDIELEQGLLREQRRAEAMAREAERATLLALRAHLDPHFLFNTLNAIAEWTHEDAAVAEKAILRLSALLRELMEGVRVPSWPLSRELELARGVWELHAIRDPERFAHDWVVPQPIPDALVPPMLLLPLVENAVKHGPARGVKGRLGLQLDVEDGLRVRIVNPGPFTGPRDGGEGLAMVRKRLALAYGGAATFAIEGVGSETVATVQLPMRGPAVA